MSTNQLKMRLSRINSFRMKKVTTKQCCFNNYMFDFLDKMKILLFLLFISVASVTANSYSQQKRLNVNCKNLTVLEAIQKIEALSDYIFIYSEKAVDLNRKVNLKAENATIDEILEQLFFGTSTEFEVHDRQIAVTSNDNNSVLQQDPIVTKYRVIAGKVVDDQDSPMPGVSVLLKGTGQGVVTNADGVFEIRVRVKEDEVLVFSFIGMKKQEFSVGDRKFVSVKMESEQQQINDVVIIGAYGTKQKRVDMVGSAFQITSKEMVNLPAGRVDLLLDGMIPGVKIDPNTDSPDNTRSRYNIRVRGEASLAASNEPLWIVDGTPIFTGNRTNQVAGLTSTVSPLSYINPNDIESITVLKDASETSIYGANGANGVILITTKKGRTGRSTVNFTTSYGVSRINESTKFKVLNAGQYMELAKEAFVNAGKDLAYFPFQDNDMNKYSTTSTDWYDVFYDLGNKSEGNISFSGGTEKSTYFISGSYYKEKQTVMGNTQERYSLRINDELKLNRKLTANFNVSASYNINNLFNPGDDYYEFLPVYSQYNEDGSFRLYNKYIDGSNQDGSPYWKTVKFFNSVAEREENDYRQRAFASNSNVALTYDFIDGVAFTSQLGVDYQSNFEDKYDARTNWSGMESDGTPLGYAYRGHVNYFIWTNIERFNFNKTIGNHVIGGVAGFEMSSQQHSLVNATGSGFINDHIKEVSYAVNEYGDSSSETEHSMSFFVKGSYSYNNKYFFLFNLRKDGDSDFGEDVRWGNFASAGVSWNIHNEDFFNIPYINVLKLKASYGTNGNSRIGTNDAQGVYSYSDSDNYIDGAGGSMSGSPNPNLSWEKTFMTNIGLRIKLFNRLDIDAEWYNNKTVDLLSELDVSRTTGSTRVYRNVGSIQNRGVEVNIISTNIRNDNFMWTTNLNMSHNKNKLLELYNGISKVMGNTIWREGCDINTYYLIRWAGVDPRDGAPLWYDVDGNITRTYSIDDRVPGKTSTPDLSGGITNSFIYKNWEFRAMLNYVLGGYAFSSFGRGVSSDGLNIMTENQSVNQLDRWQKPGDLALSPKLIWGVSTKSTMNSTRYLYNRTNIRLQNISLSYNLSKETVKKFGLSNCAISLVADNIGLWTPYDSKHRNSYRQSMSGYPMESVYSLNFDLTF